MHAALVRHAGACKPMARAHLCGSITATMLTRCQTRAVKCKLLGASMRHVPMCMFEAHVFAGKALRAHMLLRMRVRIHVMPFHVCAHVVLSVRGEDAW